MIDAGQLVNGLWMGSVLILIALTPGLVARCLTAIQSLSIMPRVFPFPNWPRTPLTFEPPRWLAFVGVAIWVIAVLAFLA